MMSAPGKRVKNSIKTLARQMCPGLYWTIQSRRSVLQRRRTAEALGLIEVTEKVVKRIGLETVAGPFAGMRYVTESVGSALIPKILGSYESELHETIMNLRDKPYETIVDVGSAEGYYAVGLARLMPHVGRIYAFDTDPLARRLCRALADLNGVGERLVIKGECTPARLNDVLDGAALLIMDCEGCEAKLVDPSRVPNLCFTTMIVECHDFLVPGASAKIASRVGATHSVKVFPATERDPKQHSPLNFLTAEERQVALSELRPPKQQWLFIEPLLSQGISP